MHTHGESGALPGAGRRRAWRRRLWWIAAAGLLIAAGPLAVALAGLALDSQYLMTYHWAVYFSVPVGLPITLIAGLAAVVMTIKDKSKGKVEFGE